MSVNSYESQTRRQTLLIHSSGSAGSSSGSGGGGGESGILNEQILVILIESLKWDIHIIARLACVCWKLRALAKRLLWKGVCNHRAPRIVATLADGDNRRISVEWHALAKGWVVLMRNKILSSRNSPKWKKKNISVLTRPDNLFSGTILLRRMPVKQPPFRVNQTFSGHFLKESRFSKTSGRSFLIKQCRDDVLYVSDPCEHSIETEEDGIGIFRGVFTGFLKSRTRAYLIRKKAPLEEVMRCPYCGCRVWSMTEARLVPRSAARRLGCEDGMLEYFVCVNGHLHGNCWLVPLSEDEDPGDSNYI